MAMGERKLAMGTDCLQIGDYVSLQELSSVAVQDVGPGVSVVLHLPAALVVYGAYFFLCVDGHAA